MNNLVKNKEELDFFVTSSQNITFSTKHSEIAAYNEYPMQLGKRRFSF